jgi:uncharacterized protein YndB with AHSA1/START domain
MPDPTMSETATTVPPVIREAIVAAPIETCFSTFVDGFTTWWPKSHHIGEHDAVEFAIEPRVGGRCYDVDTTGAESHWGTVLVYEPPTELVLAWHVQADWTCDLDPDRQSEVVVTFTPIDSQRTTVRLEHRHLERHGDGAADLRRSIDSPGGWTWLVDRYIDVASGLPPRDMPDADADADA